MSTRTTLLVGGFFVVLGFVLPLTVGTGTLVLVIGWGTALALLIAIAVTIARARPSADGPTGIHVKGGGKATITDNYVEGYERGIATEDVDDLTAERNITRHDGESGED